MLISTLVESIEMENGPVKLKVHFTGSLEEFKPVKVPHLLNRTYHYMPLVIDAVVFFFSQTRSSFAHETWTSLPTSKRFTFVDG